jgi:hypothetical protein
MITMPPISQNWIQQSCLGLQQVQCRTIKADQVTHMKTKPKFLCALRFQDMKDLTSEPCLEDNPLETLSIKKLIVLKIKVSCSQ